MRRGAAVWCGVLGMLVGLEAAAQDKPGCNLACPMAQRDPSTGCCLPGGKAPTPRVEPKVGGAEGKGGKGRRAAAPVAFVSSPPGASVWVDGAEVCAATPCEAPLALGERAVELRGSGCAGTHRQALQVERGAGQRVEVALPPREVEVEVSAVDAAGQALPAALWVDGAQVGVSPGRFPIPACAAQVEARLEGWTAAAAPLQADAVAVYVLRLTPLAPVAPPEAPPAPVAPPSADWRPITGWSLVGLGAVGLLGGGALRWSYQDEVDAIEATRDPLEYDRLRASLEDQQTLLRGVLGGSGALLAVGAGLLIWSWSDEDAPGGVALGVGWMPGGGVVEGRW